MRQQASAIIRSVVFLALLSVTAIAAGWALDQQSSSSDAKTAPQSAPAATAPNGANPQKPTSPAAGQVPTFRRSTDLVLVPAIVHDHSGRHVNGLSKDDFVVEENGKPQKLSIFEEVTTGADTRIKRASLAPGIFTNTLQQSSTVTPRINIVVLDSINTAFGDQAYARRHLIDFLAKSVERHEMTALLSLSRSGIKVVHDFTTDPGVLMAALKKVRGSTEMTSGENTDALIEGADTAAVLAETNDIQSFMEASSARVMQQFAIQYTIDGFETIANSFRGLPGRKALIWVTGSFPFQMTSPNDPPIARDFNDELAHAWQHLNDANIAVYPIDARGLVVGMTDASASQPRVARNGRQMAQATMAHLSNQTATIQTMQSFAEATGGRAFYNTNDLEKAFEHASDDSSSYYMLGFYREADDNKPGWRKLKVKVTKPGLNLRSRSGYFVTAKANESGASDDVKVALKTPMDFTGIALAVRWEDPAKPEGKPFDPPPAGKKAAIFDIVVGRNALFFDPGDNNHMTFEVVAVARTATGETAGSFNQNIDAHPKPETLAKLQQGGLTYRNELTLPPGEYSVRFVVRDVLGNRVGSVMAPLKVD